MSSDVLKLIKDREAQFVDLRFPDASTAVFDPFYADPTVNLRCDVIEPMTMQGYARDPRSLAKRAEA